jgi:hypothetical protein
MNTFSTTKKNKIAAIVAMAAVVAVVPTMLGGLISVGNVDVLSPDCDQESKQGQLSFLSKATLQSSEQSQDCDSVDVL